MIIRSLLLLLPLAIWTYVFINIHIPRKEITASFLGFVWAFHAALILNIIFFQQNIWQTSIEDNLFFTVPLDWIFSQAVICGAIIPLGRLIGLNNGVRYIIQLVMIVIIYYSAGLSLNTINAGVTTLSVLIFCATPAMLLSNWTASDTRVRARSILQALSWACLLLWLFPSIVFYLTGNNWQILLQRNLLSTGIYLLPMILPAILLVSALYQFAVEGDGTAFPYDPPKKLVTGGVYRYVSNPMQLGICLMMLYWGFVIHSLWISVSAIIAFMLFIVFKDVCNGSCAIGKGNKDWETYQKAVPKWIPRLKT